MLLGHRFHGPKQQHSGLECGECYKLGAKNGEGRVQQTDQLDQLDKSG